MWATFTILVVKSFTESASISFILSVKAKNWNNSKGLTGIISNEETADIFPQNVADLQGEQNPLEEFDQNSRILLVLFNNS